MELKGSCKWIEKATYEVAGKTKMAEGLGVVVK